jgi:hypothetical protein
MVSKSGSIPDSILAKATWIRISIFSGVGLGADAISNGGGSGRQRQQYRL